jgi:TonB family protein
MTPLISIFIEVNLLLILLFGVYQLIKHKLTFTTRRLCLIFLPVITFIALFLKENIKSTATEINIPIIQLDLITVDGKIGPTSALNFNFEWTLVIGSFLFLVFSVYKIIKIIFLFKSESTEKKSHYKLLITNKKDSFSFFNLIHLSAHLDQSEKDIVLEHELIHCEKKHSFDIILMEVYHSFFWYNPLLFLMKKELIHVHEYEVDQKMYSKYDTEYIKHLLAYTLGTNSSQLLLTSQFYNRLTLTKRTKIMTNKIKKSKLLVIALPIAAITFSLFSLTTMETTKKMTMENETSIASKNQKERIDILPEYPGGPDAFNKFLKENINYPKQSKKDNIEGTVMAKFIISKTGKIKDLGIKESVNPEIDNEAIRVIQLMPNWIPGEKDGEKVDVQFFLPIGFKLSN